MTVAVPKKCYECKNLFEGGCTRFFEEVKEYLRLDYDFCGVDGSTNPIMYEDKFVKSKVYIPKKCRTCKHLNIDGNWGFSCNKDSKIWGAFPRGLDWGTWEPDSVYIELKFPKKTTKTLISLVKKNKLVNFIKEYRKINKNYSIEEAKKDYNFIASKLRKL